MMANIIEFQTERASNYIDRAFRSYERDPADSDYQRGFLAAMLVLYREGLGKGVGDDRLELLDRQTEQK